MLYTEVKDGTQKMIISFFPQIELSNEMSSQSPLADTGNECVSFIDALLSTLAPQVPSENADANPVAVDEQKAEAEDAALVEAIGKEGEAVQAAFPAPVDSRFIEQGRALAIGHIDAENIKPDNITGKGYESVFQAPSRGLALGHSVAIESGKGLKTGLLAHTGILKDEPAFDAAEAGQAETAIEEPVEGKVSIESAATETAALEGPETVPAEFEAAEIEVPVEKAFTKEPVRNDAAEIKMDKSPKTEKTDKAVSSSAPALPRAEIAETDEVQPENVEGSAFESEAVEEASFSAGQENGFEGSGDAADNDAAHQHRPVAFVTGAKFSEFIDAPAAAQTVQSKETVIEFQEKLNTGINISVQKNGGEVRMKLNPEHLGELVIKLTIENDSVKADIRAESLEIKRLLEADFSMLKEALGAHGLTLKECTIGVSRADQNLSGNDEKWNREQSNGNNRDNENRRNEWQGGKEGGNNYGRPGKSGNIDIFA